MYDCSTAPVAREPLLLLVVYIAVLRVVLPVLQQVLYTVLLVVLLVVRLVLMRVLLQDVELLGGQKPSFTAAHWNRVHACTNSLRCYQRASANICVVSSTITEYAKRC